MNKLVSKSPIQRFKQGRKIQFAKVGDKFLYNGEEVIEEVLNGQTILRRKNGTYIYPSNRNLTKLNGESYRRVPTTPQTRVFTNIDRYTPIPWEEPKIIKYGSFDNSQYVADTNPNSKVSSIIVGQPNSAQNTQTNQKSQNQNKSSSKKSTKGKSRKTFTPSPIFAGYRIGKIGGLNYSIDDADKQQLIGTGQFTESDFKNAISTQKALNRYFVNSGLGSVKEDGAWGDQSRAALAFALSKSKRLTPLNNETTVIKTPIVPTYTPPTTPVNQEIANLKLNVNVPQQTYDRTGVRELIRNKGINPYSFSGDQRRALRMVLNNTADDNDKLLVKEMGLFKKGGLLLPSKNPVIRFRNRNFK